MIFIKNYDIIFIYKGGIFIKKYFDIDTIKDTIWYNNKVDWDYGNIDPDSLMRALEFYTTPADVQPVRHGRWIWEEVPTTELGKIVCFKCTVCLKRQTFRSHFCPNCGAEMEGN